MHTSTYHDSSVCNYDGCCCDNSDSDGDSCSFVLKANSCPDSGDGGGGELEISLSTLTSKYHSKPLLPTNVFHHQLFVIIISKMPSPSPTC